ncbi:MAG: TIGR03960 family B12-binding radical SAM protein [Lachnospiraceae bacterium]
MRKLALPDSILMQVDKSARYIGSEVNAVYKDLSDVEVRFALCFPDVYEIGMSHLGLQILYHMFNERPDTWCERVFSPWTDLDKLMRQHKLELAALESQDPVRQFDFLGFTIQYEMCYTNILQVLDLAGIPLLATERTQADPLVIGGGPCTYNPEPLADFFDLFYIGEGETVYHTLLDTYKKHKRNGGTRQAFLELAAQIPGIYVPSLYTPEYNADGTLASFTACKPGVPPTVRRQVMTELDATCYPKKPVVPFIKATQDRVTLEIQRGCIRGCRFCQAGMVYRPTRERPLEDLIEMAEQMLRATGHEEISLSSLSSSDYSQLEELITYLMDKCSREGINISLPSLRIDAFSLDVMKKVQDVRKSSLTFAPEAGSQRLRDVINKGLTREDILGGAKKAFAGGWSRVKLYFMLGLPTETVEDMEGIAALAEEIAKEYYEIPKEERQGKVQIVASASFFVPKPFTPFQWAPMHTKEEYLEKAYIVKDAIRAQLNQRSIKFNYHEADVTVLEGVFARGDRRVGRAIAKAYELGALYDAWSEEFSQEIWDEAFSLTGVDPQFYTLRNRQMDEILPWDFIDVGVTKSFLVREWERAQKAEITPNCRISCTGCGAASYKGGICVESKS